MSAGGRPRLAVASRALSLALLLCASPSHAQVVLRGEGGAPTGTTLDPAGLGPFAVPDPNGLSARWSHRLRTPAGLLNHYPWQLPTERTWGEDWIVRGSAELGSLVASGDTSEARFEKYADWSDGFFARFAEAAARRRDESLFFEARGLNLGRDDMLIDASVGSLGLYRVEGFTSGTPFPSMRDAKTPFVGLGGDSLVLPGGSGSIGNLTNAPTRSLEVQRDTSGIDVVVRPTPSWKLIAAWRRDHREGTRPTGGTLGFGFLAPTIGSVVEAAAPVAYTTDDLSLGVARAGDRLQAEVGYDLSLFSNGNSRLVWDNPFPPPPGVTRVQRALAPDNRMHGVRGQLGLAVPWRGRFTASGSWRTLRQDDALLAPTADPGAPAAWQSPSSLAQARANARVDWSTAQVQLRLSPVRSIVLNARLRYESRDHRTHYRVGLEGAPVYLAEDGAAPVPLQPRLAPPEFDREQWRAEAGLRWRIKRRLSLEAEYERVADRRSGRERNRTVDDILQVNVTDNHFEHFTMRAGYQFASRSGSPWVSDPNSDLITDAGGTAPVSAPLLRKPDLADRSRHDVHAAISWHAADSLEIALRGAFARQDFSAELGLDDDQASQIDLEIVYRPSPPLQGRLFAAADWTERSIRGLAAAGTSFPASNAWSVDTSADTLGLGAGLGLDVTTTVRIALDYQYLRFRESNTYSFASIGALSPFGGIDPAAVGSAFPERTSDDHTLDSSLRWQPFAQVGMRLHYRYTLGSIADFQQTGLQPVVGRRLFLGHVDRDFDAHVLVATVLAEY